MYLRVAALGDSSTYGIGDPVPLTVSATGWRGWARLLADALDASYDVSFCNLAVSGATAATVRSQQLDEAIAHRPDVASLIVGINDTMRSSWDTGRVRDDLMTCADALHGTGALLLTARFHDHGAAIGLPGVLRRPMMARIDVLNAAYDEVFATYGGLRVDLAAQPGIGRRESWSIDRLHPSELGHRALACTFAGLLQREGFAFEGPSPDPSGGYEPNWRRDLAWMVTEGAPWMGRRARDLGPWAMRLAWTEGVRGRVPAGR